MLKDKADIENYDMKANLLKENGWIDLWHLDNWVKVEWFNHPTINIDRAGCSTNAAYAFVLNNILKNKIR